MLECHRLNVRRGGLDVLHDLHLELEAGRLVAVLGENGAGKSTLLAAMAGELGYRGTLRLDGREISHWPAEDLARKRAVLSQSAPLSFGFNVAELVALGRYPFTESRQQQYHSVAQVLEALDLQAMARRDVTRLSGGEQQRVQFGRCLAQVDGIEDDIEPESRRRLMLLDEPTASLDLRHQHKLLSLTRAFARRGNLAIVVLHDLNLASLYADTVLLLHQGRLVKQGTPLEVLCQETLDPVYRTEMRISLHPGRRVPMIFSEPGSTDT